MKTSFLRILFLLLCTCKKVSAFSSLIPSFCHSTKHHAQEKEIQHLYLEMKRDRHVLGENSIGDSAKTLYSRNDMNQTKSFMTLFMMSVLITMSSLLISTNDVMAMETFERSYSSNAICSRNVDDWNQYEYSTQVFLPDSPGEIFVASIFGTVVVGYISSSVQKSIESQKAEEERKKKLLQTKATVAKISIAVNVPDRNDENSILSYLANVNGKDTSPLNLVSDVASELLRRNESIFSAHTERRYYIDEEEAEDDFFLRTISKYGELKLESFLYD